MSGPDPRAGKESIGGAHGAGTPESPYPHLAWLFGLQRFGMRTGLDTARELLRRLGNPESELDTVLVGGTNGKGSVARLLAACLQASGVRTGLFTSPHLQRVGERARVNGVPASDADMDRLVGAVRSEATAVEATFFEVMTAVCLLRFVEARADVAVLEVGMGGRLDATNVAAPDLTVITGVALDHTAVLGDTVQAIAAEKAGIVRPGVPLLTGAEGAALRVLEDRAAAVEAPVFVLGRELNVAVIASSWEGLELRLTWNASQVRHVPLVLQEAGAMQLTAPLVGRHQAGNVALAAFGALLLGVEPGTVQAALALTRWPGRLERREYEGRHVVLDGAHNQQAAAALARALGELEGRVAVLVLGVSADKDVDALLSELQGVASHVIFTAAVNSPRSAEPTALLEAWQRASGAAAVNAEALSAEAVSAEAVSAKPASAEAVTGTAAALRRALTLAAPGETVAVAGSLFLVAEVCNVLDGVDGEPYERWQ